MISRNAVTVLAVTAAAAMLSVTGECLIRYNGDFETRTSPSEPVDPHYMEVYCTPAEFEAKYGDSYDTKIEYNYDNSVKRGNIISLTTSPGEGGKEFAHLMVSLGTDYMAVDEKCDFTNLIDQAVYFADEDIPDNTISYNEFYVRNGSKRKVKFYEQTTVAGVRQYMMVFTTSDGRAVTFPCAYDEDDSYSFYGNFALSLEDYNGDGSPDFLYKAGSVDRNGCHYRMHITDNGYYSGISEAHNPDTVLYIYGETGYSPRLDRINREAFFYLSRDGLDRVVPTVLNLQDGYDSVAAHENNGWIFTSAYENGSIMLKGTVISDEPEQNEDFSAQISLKRLDERVWRDVPLGTDAAAFSFPGAAGSDTAVIEKELSRGVYRVEVCVNGKWTYTEFIVRSDKSSEAALEAQESETKEKQEGEKKYPSFSFSVPAAPERDESKPVTVTDVYNMPYNSLSDMKKLDIVIDLENDNTDILEEFSGLEKLTVHAVNTDDRYLTDKRFKFLENFTGLQRLSIITEQGGIDMEYIAGCSGLRELSLEGFDAIVNFESVSGLTELESLYLGRGTIVKSGMESLAQLTGLKKLHLCGIRFSLAVGMSELDFLGEMYSLEELHLEDFENVRKLPDMGGLTNLRTLEILRFENLLSYDFLYGLPGLEKFIYTENDVSEEEMGRFATAAPECRLVSVRT